MSSHEVAARAEGLEDAWIVFVFYLIPAGLFEQ